MCSAARRSGPKTEQFPSDPSTPRVTPLLSSRDLQLARSCFSQTNINNKNRSVAWNIHVVAPVRAVSIDVSSESLSVSGAYTARHAQHWRTPHTAHAHLGGTRVELAHQLVVFWHTAVQMGGFWWSQGPGLTLELFGAATQGTPTATATNGRSDRTDRPLWWCPTPSIQA